MNECPRTVERGKNFLWYLHKFVEDVLLCTSKNVTVLQCKATSVQSGHLRPGYTVWPILGWNLECSFALQHRVWAPVVHLSCPLWRRRPRCSRALKRANPQVWYQVTAGKFCTPLRQRPNTICYDTVDPEPQQRTYRKGRVTHHSGSIFGGVCGEECLLRRLVVHFLKGQCKRYLSAGGRKLCSSPAHPQWKQATRLQKRLLKALTNRSGQDYHNPINRNLPCCSYHPG